jgi:lysophospholipase L1-like esterase
VLTPLWTTEAPSTLKVPENTTDNNWMFVDAIYEGADIYGWIPINMDLCGITPFTKSGLLLDNIHPNVAGTEKIVEYLSAELASYGENSKKDTILFNKSDVSMKTGESTTLKAVQSPRSGTGTMTFTWSSSDSSVATVDASGKITAVAPGTATVTATATNGTSADITVSVACEHTYEGGVCTSCGATHPNLDNYEGKVISILGDSISTFAGYIPTADGFNLEHYARYPQSNLFTEVEHTWWMQVLTALNAKLGINESWRSTEVGNIYDVEVNSGYEGTKACMASTTRIQNLGSNGTPDVILFYGGTNDITQRRTVGTFDPATAPTEVDLTSVKWDTVADAYVVAIMRMQYYYPDAEIVAMLPTFTSKNTDAVIEQYNSVFAAICEHYGVAYIDLRDCGITTANLPDGTHPNETGMDYITAAVMDILLTDCNVESGEHIVHSVTHNLTGAESSLSYYKGVSHGKSFVTTISGDDLVITVTMGGENITASVYVDSIVNIPSVTGDVAITAAGREKTIYDDHLQQLPDNICYGMNLWNVLTPENQYYTTSGWGNLSTDQVWSITIPVVAGDRIYANSFEKNGSNGNDYSSTSGIRVTYFDADGVFKSLSPAAVYSEFAANGYLTIPENVVAVCIPMWTNTDESVVYILNRDHIYENGTCLGCGDHIGPVITQQPANAEAALGERYCVTVEAEGENLKYQWYFRNAGTDVWYKSSVRDNTYDDVMTTARAGREVYCVITDANGNSVTTDIAKLIRIPAEKLEIVTQPTNGEAILGERYCVTVEAKGEGLKYQWYFRNAGTETWYTSGVRDNTYDDIMTTARAGREVYCVITDTFGNQVTTDIVKLVQVAVKLEIITQPTDATAAFGEIFCATVEATGDGLKYQWYFRNAGSDTWYTSGVRDNTYDDIMTKARNGREVYCVITDQWGNSVTTDTVKLIAVPSVELKLLGVSYESAAMGENYCLTVNAQGEGLKYTWYFCNAGSDTWYRSGVTDNTYDDVMTKARANREVYCVITDKYGNQVTTEAVTIHLADIKP